MFLPAANTSRALWVVQEQDSTFYTPQNVEVRITLSLNILMKTTPVIKYSLCNTRMTTRQSEQFDKRESFWVLPSSKRSGLAELL